MAEHVGPSQALVLARGIEMRGSEFPGTVQYDSPDSGDSYDRAIAITRYAIDHPELKRVAFVNRCTFTAPWWTRPAGSEAEAMAEVAIDAGLNPGLVVIGDKSRSTVGGIVEAIRDDLIDPNRALLWVAHSDHVERMLRYGRLALPFNHFEVLLADNVERASFNHPLPRHELIADKIYNFALRNVEPEGIAGMERADRLVQAAFVPLVALRGTVTALTQLKTRRSVSQPGLKPA